MKDLLGNPKDFQKLLKPERKSIIQDENIIFHSKDFYKIEDSGLEKTKENPEKEREIENYRNQFEQAMIKIEDQEDL